MCVENSKLKHLISQYQNTMYATLINFQLLSHHRNSFIFTDADNGP